VIVFYANVAILALLAGVCAMALNVLVGETGIFSAAQGVFYGVGAYTGALVSIHLTRSLVFGLVCGIVAGAVAALVFAVPAVRVRGDYFIVASFGFSVIVTTVFAQWKPVTGGSAGLIGIPTPTVGPATIGDTGGFLLCALAVLAIATAVLHYVVRRAPLGRMMRAVRDDELAAAALGKSPAMVRLVAVVLAGALSGFAGVVYASYVAFVDPTGFDINQSIVFLTMVILGGAGTFWGPLAGALVVTFGTASLGLLHIPGGLVGPLQQICLGVVLILLMVFWPGGLAAMVPRRGSGAASRSGHQARVGAPDREDAR
jgi:branched-chain amino acid transport system permease protein